MELRKKRSALEVELEHIQQQVVAAEKRNQSPFFKASGVGRTGNDGFGSGPGELIEAPSGTTYILQGEKLFEYDGGGTGVTQAQKAAARAAARKVCVAFDRGFVG